MPEQLTAANEPANRLREKVARDLWGRFATSHAETWEDETSKAEYLDAANAALGLADYYLSHEALVELVSLINEMGRVGGSPGFAKRWERAVREAEELVRVEP